MTTMVKPNLQSSLLTTHYFGDMAGPDLQRLGRDVTMARHNRKVIVDKLAAADGALDRAMSAYHIAAARQLAPDTFDDEEVQSHE